MLGRPQNIAVGYHSDLLPIVVTSLGLTEAHKVDALNEKIMSCIQDMGSDDPASLLSLFKDSRAVAKIFPPHKSKKIYAVKVGVLTGIWYGASWYVDVILYQSFLYINRTGTPSSLH